MTTTLCLLSSSTETPEGLAAECTVSVLVPRPDSQSSREEAPHDQEAVAAERQDIL